MRADGRPVSIYTAKHYIGCHLYTLRRAAEQGYVAGLTRNDRGSYYATMDAWLAGYEAYTRARRERKGAMKSRTAPKMRHKAAPQQGTVTPPQGWISAAEAARRLKVSHETMLAIARARLAPVYIRRTRTSERYYAHPQAWERALRWWRQGHGAEERRKMMPRASVDAETARRRLESLTPYQRVALRAFIRAVMLGLPLPEQWRQRFHDEFETASAMYG
ncbi:MAG TPA: hypothetical protein VIK75_09700, partial [Calditerricola sp.]